MNSKPPRSKKFKRIFKDRHCLREEFDFICSDISTELPADLEDLMKLMESGEIGEIYGQPDGFKKPCESKIKSGNNVASFELDSKGNVVVLKPYKHVVVSK